MLLTHALALSANQFLGKKKSQRAALGENWTHEIDFRRHEDNLPSHRWRRLRRQKTVYLCHGIAHRRVKRTTFAHKDGKRYTYSMGSIAHLVKLTILSLKTENGIPTPRDRLILIELSVQCAAHKDRKRYTYTTGSIDSHRFKRTKFCPYRKRYIYTTGSIDSHRFKRRTFRP